MSEYLAQRIEQRLPTGGYSPDEQVSLADGALRHAGRLLEWAAIEALEQATEGFSGRALAKITLKAYLASPAPTRAELTAANFLAAVGLMPEPIPAVADTTAEAAETVTTVIRKEETV